MGNSTQETFHHDVSITRFRLTISSPALYSKRSLRDLHLGGTAIDLFSCAQADARQVAEQLTGDVGLRPVYLGDVDAAPTVDGLTRAWFAPVSAQGRGRRLALKMMQE